MRPTDVGNDRVRDPSLGIFQNGVVAIPKSVHPGRIAENVDILDFTLSDSEMAQIEGLDTGVRAGPDPNQVDTNSFSEYS